MWFFLTAAEEADEDLGSLLVPMDPLLGPRDPAGPGGRSNGPPNPDKDL